MNDSPYKLIRDLFIYIEHSDQKYKINESLSFSDYVKSVYFNILEEKYQKSALKLVELMNLEESRVQDLILEVIFLNLYQYITLMSQVLSGKGERHEHFLMTLDLPDDEYKKYKERFRKRMQPKRMQHKGIRSFKRIYSGEDSLKKYYIPFLLKAYRDVMFVPRQGTDILDISPAYSDIFTALMYEEETDFCNTEYIANRDLIKAYQIWEFTTSTISQIEKIYDMIINSSHELHSDRVSQLIFMEKLFGLLSISELLKKECAEEEYIKFAYNISTMTCLGYSTLHRTIIDKINIENMRDYQCMIDEYINPICIECMEVCINQIINYIGRLDLETRIKKVNEYNKACRDLIKGSLLESGEFTYNVIQKSNRLKKYKIKKLNNNFAVQVMKALKYRYIEKSQENEIEQCLQLLREDYTYDYNIDDAEPEDIVVDLGLVDITFDDVHQDYKMETFSFEGFELDYESEKRIEY